MQWTDQIRRVKILLVLAAVIIAVASLLVSHFLIRDLSAEEHKKMETWAEAMRTFSNADSDADLNLVLKVLNGNTYYYVRLEEESVFYSLSAVENPTAVILNVGDQVTIEHEMAENPAAILQGYSLTIDTSAPSPTPQP